MTAVRLLIADDHPIVVQGITRFAELEPTLEVIGAAASADALLALLETTTPDVISLDVQMPGMKGPRTVEAVAAAGAPVLLFTLHPIDLAIASLIHAGAAGYLPKSSSLERYVEAIHALHGGGRVLPPELEALLDAPAAKAPSELLTPREMQVFERLVMGETIKEAAFSLGLSVSTVYTYSDRIRTKLGVRTQPELVRYAASWDLDQR